jgi:hypothetical protein
VMLYLGMYACMMHALHVQVSVFFFVCMRARSMVDLRMKFRLVSSIVSIGCPESLLRM